MKRFFTIMVCAIMAVSAVSAQKYESISHRIEVIKDKKEKTYFDHGANWFVKAGGGFIIIADESVINFKYNAQFGYQRQIEKHGIYIGGLVGIQNVNRLHFNSFDGNTKGVALYIEPMVGIKCKMKGDLTFDFYIAGGYGRGLFNSTDYEDDVNRGVWEVSPGFWIKRFYIGLAYQGSIGHRFDHAGLINLGFKF